MNLNVQHSTFRGSWEAPLFHETRITAMNRRYPPRMESHHGLSSLSYFFIRGPFESVGGNPSSIRGTGSWEASCCVAQLLTGHEPGRVGAQWIAPRSVAVGKCGASRCPVGRLVPEADSCIFWRASARGPMFPVGKVCPFQRALPGGVSHCSGIDVDSPIDW